LPKPEQTIPILFRFFNEVGIINQLSSRLFETRLPDGFLVSHFTVLNHLTRLGDGRTPMDIATALQVPKTSLTHTLSGLNKAGLITLEPNPKDARSKCVMLTEAGRKFREDAIAALGPDLMDVAEHVPPDRIAEALPLLEEIRAFLDKRRDG
jgi:DNA-binding MarR family transcriptional regulator